MITDFTYVFHTLEGITQVTVTFSEDFDIEDPDKQEVFTIGRILPGIGNTYVPVNDFSRRRQLVGFTTVSFDSYDTRIPKLGMIYYTCGDWTPPSQDPPIPQEDPDNESQTKDVEGTDTGGSSESIEVDVSPDEKRSQPEGTAGEDKDFEFLGLTFVEAAITGFILALALIILITVLIYFCACRK